MHDLVVILFLMLVVLALGYATARYMPQKPPLSAKGQGKPLTPEIIAKFSPPNFIANGERPEKRLARTSRALLLLIFLSPLNVWGKPGSGMQILENAGIFLSLLALFGVLGIACLAPWKKTN